MRPAPDKPSSVCSAAAAIAALVFGLACSPGSGARGPGGVPCGFAAGVSPDR
jgi:hypothetical protein